MIGLLIERKGVQLTTAIYANLVGTALILLCGMIQLQSLLDLSWSEALKAGVIPFLPVGIIKALLAAYFGVLIQKKGRNSPLRKTA
ncbi:biotin transporter BioY [Halobacillus sp. BAB-2008]|uniref:biotin transporter BioY n=1 Tax=Halobacillus sp. BAB-2008 TaxID=1246484 RepID=UPI0002F5F9C5|nr:biotin transporter BioY [Halobacillus sp. BAB-2008]